MNHSLNLTHDGTLIVRVPKGYKVEKVKVETFEGEEIPTHTTSSNTLDCVERQAAIDNLERYRELFSWDDGDRERAILSRVIKELQSMPSVQPRKGKWINHLDDDGHHIADCSECGHAIQWFDDEDEPKYCCLCGSYNGGDSE